MNKLIFNKIMENERLLNHFKEQSYWIKELNRNPAYYDTFVRQMKIVYKERTSDKISSAIDNIDILSTLVDTLE